MDELIAEGNNPCTMPDLLRQRRFRPQRLTQSLSNDFKLPFNGRSQHRIRPIVLKRFTRGKLHQQLTGLIDIVEIFTEITRHRREESGSCSLPHGSKGFELGRIQPGQPVFQTEPEGLPSSRKIAQNNWISHRPPPALPPESMQTDIRIDNFTATDKTKNGLYSEALSPVG